MEKTLFISTLKEKAGVENLSERTFDEVATMFLPQFEDDTKITDESWGVPVQVLKSMSGQLRHDLSEGITAFKTKSEADQQKAQAKAIADAVAAAKAEWEKQKGAGDGGADDGKDANKDLDSKIAEAVAKAMGGLTGEEGALGKLSKQFGDFVAQMAADKKAKDEEAIRSVVREYLLGRGVKEDDFALEYTMEKLEIGENPDISALKAKAEEDYEANYKKIHKSGEAPFHGGAGGGNDNSGAAAWLKNRGALAQQEADAAEERKKLLK